MATYFWVNGSGTWNGTNTGNWSTLSGGSSGSGPPTAADDVVFDVASNGAGTGAFGVTVSTGATCRNFTASGLDGTMTLQGTVDMTVAGSLSFPASNFASTYTGSFTFTSTGAAMIQTSVTLASSIVINGIGGTFTLQGNLVSSSTRTLTLTNGTFDANGNNVSIGNLALGSGTKTLTLGSGTWTMLGANWNANSNVAGLTVSASTGTISMTSASSKTFAGGGKTWPTLNQGGAGALTIQQSNTFTTITNTVQPATVRLAAGTTQTISYFSLAGTSGNLITLDTSTAGSTATLSDASGTNRAFFCSIKDIIATGGAIWQALTKNGNTDGGNNTGWRFSGSGYIYSRRKNKVI